MVSASASASDSILARTRNGHELAVFGSVLAGSAGAAADDGVVVDGTGSAVAGAPPAGTRAMAAGTSSSLVPSGSLTISWLPTTLMTSKLLVSVAVDVCCASDTLAVAHTTAARIIQLITRVIDSLHF